MQLETNLGPLANMATDRWCRNAPSRSAASRMGMAALAPVSAMARMTRAAPSATRFAGCMTSWKSGLPREAVLVKSWERMGGSVVWAPGSQTTAPRASMAAMLRTGEGGGSLFKGTSSCKHLP